LPADNATPTTTIEATSAPESPAKGRGLTAGIIDRRTREWRRRCELVAAFTQALGGEAAIGPLLASKVEAAADLAVVAEMTRAVFMRGEGATADDVVRTARLASTAERALAIEPRANRVNMLKDV
jgi:hypothetical protein